MVVIREIGRVVPIDKNGELTENVSSHHLIKSPWKEAIDELIQAYKKQFEDRLQSVYLRGSVARGEAIEGISDLDVLGILKSEAQDEDNAWRKEFKPYFEDRYPLVAKIDCAFVPLQELLMSPRKTGVRILLKTQGLLLFGEDILEQIPAYKPDLFTLAQLSVTLTEEVRIAPERLASMTRKESKQYIHFLMKQLLRGAFLLVMPIEKVFTRDLYPCYALFSKHYPEHESSAKKALQWALEAPANSKDVSELVTDFGTWVVEEKERLLAQRQ